jgi:hypothetical protein
MRIRHSTYPAIHLLVSLLILTFSPIDSLPAHADETKPRSATVTRVIDGDTIEVRYDNGQNETVRLIGVDTPETHVPNDPSEFEGVKSRAWLRLWGKRATAYAKRSLQGKRVELLTDTNVQNRGYFDRLLLIVGHNFFTSWVELKKQGIRVISFFSPQLQFMSFLYIREIKENKLKFVLLFLIQKLTVRDF